MEKMAVYLHGTEIGSLCSDKGRLSFKYDDDYLKQDTAVPLSYSLPLTEEPYTGGIVAAYFSNLLPDESVRVRVAKYLGISAGNIFALLKYIGEDCAGAVSLIPTGRAQKQCEHHTYRKLTEDEAHKILKSLPERPLYVGSEGFHISGAGAQDKLVACIQDGIISLPLYGTPSTHIIKPDITRYPQSVYNEYYCMKLSRACGIDTADCDIIFIKKIPYYTTVRYDRVREKERWERIHQEDFCQLLGYEPTVKYESEGGPGVIDCFQLLRNMELPASDIIEFLRRIIFIFLIGNGDAHAKNFSVIYRDKKPRLAPAYDVLSTTVYPELPAKLAMKIEGRNGMKWMSRGKFIRMGKKAGLTERLVNTEIDKLLKRLETILAGFTAEIQQCYPASIYEKIRIGIEARMEQLKRATPC